MSSLQPPPSLARTGGQQFVELDQFLILMRQYVLDLEARIAELESRLPPT